MSFSDYFENALVSHLFWHTSLSAAPATLYLAVGTATDETTLTEPVGNNYSRVAITSSVANWSSSTNGVVTNVSDIDFPAPSGSWGTLTHCGLYDASTSGNLLLITALTGSRAITTGDTLRFSAGNIVISIN